MHTDMYSLVKLPSKHRFPMGVFKQNFRCLQASKCFSMFDVHSPVYVGSALSKKVHSPEYVDSFVTGTIAHKEWRACGLPWSSSLVQRTLWEVSGTLSAAELAVSTAGKVALSTAGGAHHAKVASCGGFCIQSDHCIAVASLINRGMISRALILDFDTHQGDGTANIFGAQSALKQQAYPGVYTCSVHASANFPVKKETSDLDVPLPSQTEDQGFLAACADALRHSVKENQPDLIVYISGVDPYIHDPLGQLHVSWDGLYKRDLMVFDYAASRQIPICGLVGGGYAAKPTSTADGLQELAQRHCLMHEAAVDIYG